MEIDWDGVRRARKNMGGEQCLLLLKTKRTYSAAELDDAVPADEGDGPANGGWFPTPQGWMLFVEGLDSDIDPWLELLAQGLEAAGVEGVLGGGRTVGPPKWEEPLRFGPLWSANLGFAPDPGFRDRRAWACGPETLEQVVELGVGWLAAHEAQIQADVDLRASFWAENKAAARILSSEVHRRGAGVCQSFQRDRQDVRGVAVDGPCRASFTSTNAAVPWQDTINELRSLLLSLDTSRLSVATISHLDWGSYFGMQTPGSAYFSRFGYKFYPDRWHEFTLDPCGIQILTDQHLAKAHDLTGWTTTRLDAHHYLVETRDPAAWYATPLPAMDGELPDDLIARARADFGDMILTNTRARELGLNKMPPRDT